MKIDKFCAKFLGGMDKEVIDDVKSILFLERDKPHKEFKSVDEAVNFFNSGVMEGSFFMAIMTGVPHVLTIRKNKRKSFMVIGRALGLVYDDSSQLHFFGNPTDLEKGKRVYSLKNDTSMKDYTFEVKKADEKLTKERDVDIFLYNLDKN